MILWTTQNLKERFEILSVCMHLTWNTGPAVTDPVGDFAANPPALGIGQIEVEGIGQAGQDVEDKTDVDCILDGLVADAGRSQRLHIIWGDCRRMAGQFLQKAQGSPQPLIDRRGSPISQHGLDGFVCDGIHRNCGVNLRSKLALEPTGDKRAEQLQLTFMPG